MATSFLQKARERKIIYFGIIAALFTVSLIHRLAYLNPEAYRLQLREKSRGEVELTSSAVRLMLTGSRGLAVTLLWYNAMDKQRRNEWHELELLVKSITKLQPYFITPWLYQSWNISFNVAVECDRPRDKYFYISRGIELLAEGERRNRGAGDETAAGDANKIVFPGNPELRHFMGFYYQLKIGTSDERLTMRSLLEMSCIDPLERDPRKFWGTNEKNEEIVKLKEFADFTNAHPRLVRRLREQLGFSDPASIVRFLDIHQSIPNRFKPSEKADSVEKSELKEPIKQFPLLPPWEGDAPDPTRYDLTSESVDVFLVCRAWYQFAQKPLPPYSLDEDNYDKLRYRKPKQMVMKLFRAYPPRAQVNIAEMLESEGFFDSTGWVVTRWFDDLAGKRGGEILNADGELDVGTDRKYHSGWAWERGYQAYLEYGTKFGIYLPPELAEELTKKAELARKELKLIPGQMLGNIPSGWDTGEKRESIEAHLRLYQSGFHRSLGNFDTFLNQADGERRPTTVYARRLLFVAQQKRRTDPPSEALLRRYDEAWAMYLRACFELPSFAQVLSMQEDLYEIHQKYLRISQDVRRQQFTQAALWAAHHTFAPTAGWPEVAARYYAVNGVEQEKQRQLRIIPFVTRRGPLDAVYYYDAPGAKALRETLFLWTQGAQLAMNPTVVGTVTYPGLHYYQLTLAGVSGDPPFLAQVSPEMIRDLEKGELKNLRQELAKRKVPLSDVVGVANVEEGRSWRIEDRGMGFSYFAYREGEAIKIYGPQWRPVIDEATRTIVAQRPGMKR